MPLFREKDRHPKDKRILVINDIVDFTLWKERKRHQISGILINANLTQEEQKTVAKWATQRRVNDAFPCSYRQGQFQVYPFTEEIKSTITPALRAVFKKATLQVFEVLKFASNEDNVDFDLNIPLKINTTHHQNFCSHHDPTIVHIIAGSGTFIQNEASEEYQLESNQIIIFDSDINHRAPIISQDQGKGRVTQTMSFS